MTDFAPYLLDRTGEYYRQLLINTGSTVQDAVDDHAEEAYMDPLRGTAEFFAPNWSNQFHKQLRNVFVGSGAVACEAFCQSTVNEDAQQDILGWVAGQYPAVELIIPRNPDRTFLKILERATDGHVPHPEFAESNTELGKQYVDLYNNAHMSRVATAGAGFMLMLLDEGWQAIEGPRVHEELKSAGRLSWWSLRKLRKSHSL